MNDEERALMAKRIRRAAGEWLTPRAWTHFVTPTFRWNTTVHGAKRATRRFIRHLEQRSMAPVMWLAAFEHGRHLDRVHSHLLLGVSAKLSSAEIEAVWRAGNITVARYNPMRAAAAYVAKVFGSEYDDWDIGRKLPRLLTPEELQRDDLEGEHEQDGVDDSYSADDWEAIVW